MLRAFYVLGPPQHALLLGAGLGQALTQTHYTLQDVGGNPVGLDATSSRTVTEVTAAARGRLFRGLEARAEVSALLRDGRLELLPILGIGAAF